jgi:hypothetical protein
MSMTRHNVGDIQDSLGQLNKALNLYVRASGMSMDQVLAKKGPQLGYQLHVEFKSLRPGRGSVREQRLAALKAGEGVRVRPAVYAMIAEKYGALPLSAQVMRWRTKGGKVKGTTAKGLNLQALAVQRELNLRESGRGFLGQAARFIGWSGGNDVSSYSQAKAESRYGAWLAKAGLRKSGAGPELTMEWGGVSEMSYQAVKGISRARGMSAVVRAINAVTSDMVPYLQSHLDKTAQQMGLKV